MKKKLISFLALISLFSCQTEIDVKLPNYYNKLVVEGYIENGEYPVVSLYRSIPYFSTMSLEYLKNNILVRDARVFITSSRGEEQELFLNDSLQPNYEYPLFYAYSTKKIIGELNTSYTLKIEYDGKTYSSETKILEPFDLDSIFFVPRFGQKEIDTAANLRIKMTDNGQGCNYYQFKVKVHREDKKIFDRLWLTSIPAAFDDSPFKGITFNYEILRGSASVVFMPEMTDEERRQALRRNYRVGDTVYVRYGRIDASSYQFWQTASGELTFGKNPFMSPEPIISNIKCNTGEKCLGVWCGTAKKEMIMILDTTTTKPSATTFRVR